MLALRNIHSGMIYNYIHVSCIYKSMYESISTCIYVCMLSCLYIYVCTCICIHIHINTVYVWFYMTCDLLECVLVYNCASRHRALDVSTTDHTFGGPLC